MLFQAQFIHTISVNQKYILQKNHAFLALFLLNLHLRMKLNIRFFLSWILTSLVMFVLFYLWHGVFLNDLKRIQFPISWFITFAAVTYLVLGAGMYFLFESRLLKSVKNFLVRGLFCGLTTGLTVFMMATIVNISITKQLSINHLLIDCSWQVIEQMLGAMVVVVLKIVIHEPQVEHA